MPVPPTSHTCDAPIMTMSKQRRRFDCLDRYLNFDLSAWRCKKPIFVLACAYFIGLFSGVLISMSASDALVSTMRAAVFGRVSIFGLLSTILLPLLFSAFAVYISRPVLLIPIAFFKAFLFSFLGMGILAAFGSAGWLVRCLLMFSDILTMPLLWWYWIRSSSNQGTCQRSSLVCAAAVCLIGSLDYCVISPFLANLISY